MPLYRHCEKYAGPKMESTLWSVSTKEPWPDMLLIDWFVYEVIWNHAESIVLETLIWHIFQSCSLFLSFFCVERRPSVNLLSCFTCEQNIQRSEILDIPYHRHHQRQIHTVWDFWLTGKKKLLLIWILAFSNNRFCLFWIFRDGVC